MTLRLPSLLGALRRKTAGDHEAGTYLPARLGIDGLLADAGEIRPGGLYIVMLPEEVDPVPLLADTLAISLPTGSRMAVCDTDPEALAPVLRKRLAHLEPPGLVTKNLSLFAYDPVLLERPTDNIWDFTRSMENQDLHRADCLIFMSATRLMPAHSRAAMQRQLVIYKEWHAYHGVAGIYVVRPADLLWSELLRHVKHLDGLARLGNENQKLHWQVPAWHGASQRLHDGDFPLGLRQDGSLYSLGAHQEQEAMLKPALDEHRVLTCWNPSRRGQSAPVNWDIYDSADELVTEAASTATAATVILEYQDGNDFEALARRIHTLRIACGRRLKIFVREVDARIDYVKEMQLYHVGATRIMRADLSLSECFRAISSLKGQWYWRAIEPDFEAFFASAHTNERYGYLPPVDFTATVDEFMRCSMNTNVESVLVQLTLRSDQHHLAAINAFRADRPGVFITTDDKHLYLFLFASPASDVDAAMGRLFAQPVGELFAFYEVIVLQKDVEKELERLRYNAEYVGYTDYSELLQNAGGVH